MEVKLKHARNLFRSGLASCLLLSPTLAAALGLGTIEHSSWLGEPLKAEIEVLDPKGEYSPEDIRLRQIYPEEAAALGVDVVAIRLPLRTDVQREGGKLLIKLSTDRPVSEPFLNFMLALEWPTGKSYREYSLLLDPKDQQQIQAPVASAPNRQTTSDRPGGRPVLINEGQANRSASRPAVARPVPSAPISSGDNAEYWRVRPGQTLSQIAQKVRIDSNIQLQAVTNHLYRSNPQAFEGGIDQLQVGANLRLPSKIEYAQMPRWRDEPVQALENLPAQAAPAAATQVAASNTKVDYTVQPGDTLSQVAQKMRQDPNIALQKVIDDIYQQNPDAFSGGKHSLRVGAKLELRGEAAMPTHKVSMNAVDVSDVSPEVPDASAFDGVNPQASDSEVNGRLRLSDANVTEEQVLNGELPSTEQMPIKQQIQVVSELTDKLNLENRELRQRIAAVDSSDSVELMQELVLLQSKQIEHFQQQLKQTLSLLEQQKEGNGSLDGTLATLTSSETESPTELPAEVASNESDSETQQAPASNANELLGAEAVEDTRTDDIALAQDASTDTEANKETPQTTAEGEDIYEGQGVGAQLADQAKSSAAETDSASTITLQADSSASSSSLKLWLSLLVAAVLAALAWLDFRRPGGFLNRFNKPAEEREEPSYSPSPAVAANEPVVRVRKREELEVEDNEPVVQVPLAPAEAPEAPEDEADMEPMITGVARWNRKDIPMLHVEESEVEDLSSDDEKTDENLNFDDFGLMNTISIDDLDINLDDGLEEGFKLDLDDDEEDKQNKAQ
ncbi:LysM peptidoglycan-binding domain-containing protein [Pseudoteredinibacter isoporae]|uniref:LysM repeat protein/regulator of replication initiation timing n=1 Tax=Pseudoteredinibacter isoporae TaxID=570281 RepID=A0A7X0JU54_9GAMM|nr:LysM peptidoglycan-binding domain-containing protein [Pseudoteredinibacter isoporae]MBB6522294.1 LysM repeat protein/regulator of replication initiation timing [Pseudoteredinibacter isoporae]NHO87827.1 LysM peptidoglycan-binding domain-containing protein [Pseudoteredinibacter isoporae]NIB23842.1 LysM peptidoglycan-binding domain-containing protein [Pseudoteredinibacter isoporae]